MNTTDPQLNGNGNTQTATGPGNDGGDLRQSGDQFWQSQDGFLRSLAERKGLGLAPSGAPMPAQNQQQNQDPDYQEYLRWKAAKEGKDPRQVLELAGLGPMDVLSNAIFGGDAPKDEPKVDPVEAVRNELIELKQSIQEERQQRQSVEEKIQESRAKQAFVDQVRSMEDLQLVKQHGDVAIDTAWNLFVMDAEEAMEKIRNGQQVPIPTLRQAVVEIENRLRESANLSGELMGASKRWDRISLDGPSATEVTTPEQQRQPGVKTGPTLTNDVGHSSARSDDGPATPQELRRRALEKAAQLRSGQ